MGIYLISIWLLGGAIALILARRPSRTSARASRAESISIGLFIVGVATGVTSTVTGEPWTSAFVWTTLAFVNLALATAGWDGSGKLIAGPGFFGTLAALVLIALHSFSSLPVMVAAGLLCLGGALLARSVDRPVAPR